MNANRVSSEELTEALDIEFFLERESLAHKPPTRGSSGLQINVRCCPACGNSNWKVYLNAESGLGNCFRCGEPFTKLGFVHQALGRAIDSRKEWAETYADVKAMLREQGWRAKRTVTAAVELGPIALPASIELPTPSGQNLVYLDKRGITAEIAGYFHLRYCERGRWEWVDDAGLRHRQWFNNRVIIPVFDLAGELVTFQGRDILGTADQKYLFPTGLPGTGRFLLNGQNAWHAKRACLGEGAFDVIAIKLALDEDPALRDVAPLGSFGKHLSFGSAEGNDQLGRFLELKRGGLEEVTIMWDGEIDALNAAIAAAEILTQVGLRVRLALLPAAKDPNEVPGAVVRDAFLRAQPFSKILAIKWRLNNPYAGNK